MLREETPWQSSLYIYEPNSYAPLARVDQQEGEAEQKLYYFHTDQIGTPLEMTDVDPWGLERKTFSLSRFV
ncbi:RHS domain-containing protein [Pseudomonas sp. F3-2]|uniref:RHS domain-containing protein n=1 Tax=Pseudomonas sp. F3-2 TaxID=3141539 RepID=UPI00315D0434